MALSQNPDVPAPTALDQEIRDTFHLAPLPTDVCFYCGGQVFHPCIYWHGHMTEYTGMNIWVHGECVVPFLKGLMMDVVERYLGVVEIK